MALDHDSLVRLLIRERVKLIGYVRAIVGDEHAAEDVFQQISVLVLRKGDAIHDAEHFLAWMRTASRLEALNAMRARRRSPLALNDHVAELLDPHWQRYDAVESSVMIDALRRCLGELTPNTRRLIEMRYRQAMSSAQIAEALSRKATAVYQAISRAHHALAECIGRRMEVADDA